MTFTSVATAGRALEESEHRLNISWPNKWHVARRR